MPATWEILEQATTKRKQLLLTGYSPLPAVGKRPAPTAWQNLRVTEEIIDSWFDSFPDALNTGILTADVPAVDIDVLDNDVAEEIEMLLWETLGTRGSIRFGKRPKRASLCRTDTPFKKIVTPKFTAPNGTENKVEILGDGQQIIISGIHPDTHQPYAWFGGEPGLVRRADLPELSEEQARAFIDKAEGVLRAQPGWIEKKPDKTTNGAAAPGTMPNIFGCMATASRAIPRRRCRARSPSLPACRQAAGITA
jgi:hypothetical protein